jgi:hypothetical protein
MPKKKTVKPEEAFDGLGDFNQFLKPVEKPKEPVITSITINPNGTIFGLADNKVFVYDDISKTWKQR